MRRLAAAAALIAVFAAFQAALPAQMPEFGAPPEMKKVAYLVGKWETDFHSRNSPSEEWTTSRFTMTAENILNGSAQRMMFKGKMMGMDFEGVATVTYNRETKEWQSVWVDNMSANQTVMKGEFEGNKMIYRGESSFMGQRYLMRDISEKVSDKEFRWHMEMSFDDGASWYVAMKGTYKKIG